MSFTKITGNGKAPNTLLSTFFIEYYTLAVPLELNSLGKYLSFLLHVEHFMLLISPKNFELIFFFLKKIYNTVFCHLIYDCFKILGFSFNVTLHI